MVGNDSWSIVAELMGKQADLLVLDGEGHILVTLHDTSRRIGAIYQAPPAPHFTFDLACSPNRRARRAMRRGFPFLQGWNSSTADARRRWLRKRWHVPVRHIYANPSKSASGGLRLCRVIWSERPAYELYSRYGELLKGNLARITAGRLSHDSRRLFRRSSPGTHHPARSRQNPSSQYG